MLSFIHTKVFVAIAAGLIGIGLGGAAAQPETEVQTKTVEVEKTVEIPVEKVVDREVEVEVTPEICLTALSQAREGFQITSQMMDVLSTFIGAASEFDIDAMQAQTSKMTPLNRKLSALAPQFQRSSAACEAS